MPIYRNGQMENAYWTYGYSPVLDNEAKVVGVIVVCTETTQQVLALQRLQQSEQALSAAKQELHAFMVQAPIGIALLRGPQHIYSFVNPKFMSLLFGGRPAEDLLYKSVREALPELRGQGFYEILDDVYETGRAFVGSKLRAVMAQANGVEKEMFVNFTYQAKRDEAGIVDGILVVIYEVTDQVNEQKEIESLAANLRTAILSRDTFLAVASHELNTPLTSLKMQSQRIERLMAREGLANITAAQMEKFVVTTVVQTTRLERLVHDMLDVSRANAGTLPLVRQEGNLSALITGALERFLPQLEAAGCHSTWDIAPELNAVFDATRIEQVLGNLLTNALRYAPKSPVHVSLQRVDAMARVAVRDAGKGIASADLARIFGRFERATSRSEMSGLGLGLFISKQIVQAHGGTMDVLSNPGEGATFSFSLPLA